MTVEEITTEALDTSISRAIQRIRVAIFGDRFGFLLFLGALVYFGLYWRIGIFVTDNWTLANTLLAILDGQLYVEETVFGPPGANTPGYHIVGDRLYGRNYGQLFLAIPIYYLVDAISLVADVRIAIAGAWSLLLMGVASRVGALVEERAEFVVLGSLSGLGVFAINVGYASPLAPRWHSVVALQLTNMLLAALIGVLLYRFVSELHDRRIGLYIGAGTVLATPVGFWASLPKRHILVSLLAVITFYAFYRNRESDSDRDALGYRVLAYAAVGYWAWVHAPEALVMLAVLAPLDLLTARSNSVRQLATVGAGFGLSLSPFLLTNWAISGQPLVPPRFLERVSRFTVEGVAALPVGLANLEAGAASVRLVAEQTRDVFDTVTGEFGFGLESTSADVPAVSGHPNQAVHGSILGGVNPDSGPLLPEIVDFLGPILAPLNALLETLGSGIDVVIHEPNRLVYTFLISAPAETRAGPTDLAMLEATPLFGLLIGVPAYLAIRWVREKSVGSRFESPEQQAHIFAVVFVIALSLLYLSRLPTRAMWTVRYLLPIVPFGMYGIAQLEPVRAVLADRPRLLVGTFAGLVLIGGQLWIVLLALTDPFLGQAVQWQGMLGVVTAMIGALWVVIATFSEKVGSRSGAIVLATVLASGTLFVLLSGLEYFVFGDFALAISEFISWT